MTWNAVDEEKCYKTKDLYQIVLPDLPHTVVSWETWCNAVVISLGAIDRTADSTLVRWIRLPMEPTGDNTAAINMFHDNSQNLILLDRWLGARLCQQKHQDDSMFGPIIKSYIQHCRLNGITPRGRAIVVQIALRFRVDRNAGNHITSMELFKLQLRSFKLHDVRAFIEDYKRIMGQLPACLLYTSPSPRDS